MNLFMSPSEKERASPRVAEKSSSAPYAHTLNDAFETLLPNIRDVVPESPAFVEIFITRNVFARESRGKQLMFARICKEANARFFVEIV